MRHALLLLLAVALLGCGSAPENKDTEPEQPRKEEPEKKPDRVVNVGEGEMRVYDDAPKPNPLWDVEWEGAQVQVDEKASGSGVMSGVSGNIYSEGKLTATFKADGARGDKQNQTLVLKGNVTVSSKSFEAVLTCKELVYEAENKVIKAKGNVKVTGGPGTVDADSEIWVSPDLGVVATPNMYR